MDGIRFCPYCGSDKLTYREKSFPVFGFCPKCEKWISAEEYRLEEVDYIIQKLRMISKIKMEVKE